MKALVFTEHGSLEKVNFTDMPKPEIGPDEVLLETKAAALNRLDLWVLAGWPGLDLKLPHVVGSDGAGVIAKIGTNVTDYQIGDRVAVNPTLFCQHCAACRRGEENLCERFSIIGENVDGFCAEYIVVPARNLLHLPEHVTFASAAAASLVFITAWHSLITRGQLHAGESVLIIGAAGGVNTAAIQIARLAGAGPIYVVGSSSEKLDLARDLGADVTINRHQEDWGKAVFKATGRQGVDVVVDNVGAATFFASLRSLRKGGRLLTVGNTSGPNLEIDNRFIFLRHLSIIGSSMGTTDDYVQVMKLLFDGRLRPVIDSIYPIQDGQQAFQRLQEGQVLGKVVIDVETI
jgi:NADPH:quinone reductase-like Zn-dependent oxidoreductase